MSIPLIHPLEVYPSLREKHPSISIAFDGRVDLMIRLPFNIAK